MSLQDTGILLTCKSMQRFDKVAYSLQKDIKVYRKQQLDVITRVTFNLTCGKGVAKLQNLTNLSLSSFAESHQMQKNFFYVNVNKKKKKKLVVAHASWAAEGW